LNKVVGLLQARFGAFPVPAFVALSDTARLTGDGASSMPMVMKAERIVDVIRAEIASQRRGTGLLGLLPGNISKGTFSLTDAELDRIRMHLLGRHVSLRGTDATPTRLSADKQPTVQRPEQLESLSCKHCHGTRVAVVFRRDHCLQCAACGKYTPLNRICPRCGRPAAIRGRGDVYFRVCDGDDGCGAEVPFWRSPT
jgi:hypothetical protein